MGKSCFKNPVLLVIACLAILITGYAVLKEAESIHQEANSHYSMGILSKAKKALIKKDSAGKVKSKTEKPSAR